MHMNPFLFQTIHTAPLIIITHFMQTVVPMRHEVSNAADSEREISDTQG